MRITGTTNLNSEIKEQRYGYQMRSSLTGNMAKLLCLRAIGIPLKALKETTDNQRRPLSSILGSSHQAIRKPDSLADRLMHGHDGIQPLPQALSPHSTAGRLRCWASEQVAEKETRDGGLGTWKDNGTKPLPGDVPKKICHGGFLFFTVHAERLQDRVDLLFAENGLLP